MTRLSWQVAQVISVQPDRIRLRFDRPDFCHRCQRGEGCGAGVFGALFPRRSTEIELTSDCSLQPGDWVRVGLSQGLLATGALLAWGLPMLAFIAGALPAHWLIESEGVRDALALAGGLTAGVATFVLLRSRLSLPPNLSIEPLSCGADDSKSDSVPG